jgi:hypothetical protein
MKDQSVTAQARIEEIAKEINEINLEQVARKTPKKGITDIGADLSNVPFQAILAAGGLTAWIAQAKTPEDKANRVKQALFIGSIGLGARGKKMPKGSFTSLVDKKMRAEIPDDTARFIADRLSGGKSTLGDVLQHPALYKHYPDLKLGNITVNIHSAHIYQKHFKLVKSMITDFKDDRKITLLKPISENLGQKPEYYFSNLYNFVSISK